MLLRRKRQGGGSMPSAWMICCMSLSVLGLYIVVNNGCGAPIANNSESTHKAMVSFELAKHESLGFFTDITDEAWLRRKKINLKTRHHVKGYERLNATSPPRAWYQNNWNEDFSCFHEVGVGGIVDGHKFVCDPHRFGQDCLVYSFGSNSQFDFELALNELAPHCEIHIFDPTEYKANMLEAGVKAHYHAWGLSGSYEEAPNSTSDVGDAMNEAIKSMNSFALGQIISRMMGGNFRTLQDTLVELGHVGRRIDVFKIDCEGCEWNTYRDWAFHSDVDIRQIAVEVHGYAGNTNRFFQDLRDQNYVIFHKEPNIEACGGDCVEFSFLKLHKDFFG